MQGFIGSDGKVGRRTGGHGRARGIGIWLLLTLVHLVGSASQGAAQDVPRTRVVILGVGHSTQLVEERQQPAALRAFFDRVQPDAIGVERDPEPFARGDHYEFTYEIQYIALPYAQERGLPVHPIDWIPPRDDLILGFGVDLEEPPEIRGGWQGFLAFPDPTESRLPLLFADSEEDRASRRAPWQEEWAPPSRDLPRRLFLYRTFLQARRIAEAAALHPGGTLLVPVGVNHKEDIERILADHPRIEIVQPSTFGTPSPGEVEGHILRRDLVAIASFNLLGIQWTTGEVDWDWMRRVVRRLEEEDSSPEVRLLATRLQVLTGELPPEEALHLYHRIAEEAGDSLPFTWTGVKDRARLDSYFDPFGNLSVGQRARLEAARELLRLGREGEALALREGLARELPPRMERQLEAYWDEHLAHRDGPENGGP
jgi:hypothetical protein